MYESLFNKIGLNKNQIIVYETLLKKGPLKANKIYQKTPFKRVLVYKILNDLINLRLVEKDETIGPVAVFKPTHPFTLQELVDKKTANLKDVQAVLKGTLPKLISDFNLISGKPGVRFFEGVEGLKQIYEDTLINNKKIYGLVALGAVEPNLNQWLDTVYVEKRAKAGIFMQAITPDSKAAQTYHELDKKYLRESLVVPADQYPMKVEINIYAKNKIAFISFQESELIGIIVESPAIYATMRTFFKLAWQQAMTVA